MITAKIQTVIKPTDPECSRTAVVSGIVKHALSSKRKPAVLTQATRRVVNGEQVVYEVWPRRARSPAHRLLQNADTPRRKVFHRVLTITPISYYRNSTILRPANGMQKWCYVVCTVSHHFTSRTTIDQSPTRHLSSIYDQSTVISSMCCSIGLIILVDGLLLWLDCQPETLSRIISRCFYCTVDSFKQLLKTVVDL